MSAGIRNTTKQMDGYEYQRMTNSPMYWVRQTFALMPQPVRPEYAARLRCGLLLRGKDWDKFCASVNSNWFDPYEVGRHLTWQQTLVLYGVEKALRGECSPRISVVSGHGIGKSMIVAILILWFLFTHIESQVACTSPGAEQMYDVLWKELKKWIDLMPENFKNLYIWESTHIRMTEAPQTWFARAKTSSKENTEALAGIHAEWVLVVADEASGVEEPIFETMDGSLTGENFLVFLIGNGTRAEGYFYDSQHKKDMARWQTYSFSAVDSPRVSAKSVSDWKNKYGDDSVQYKIRVLGEFPDEGVMDDAGYVQLFNETDIHIVPADRTWRPVPRVHGALDPSGEGQDSSEWAVRDRVRAAVVASEKKSTPAGLAQTSLTICDTYRIDPYNFVVDAFGAGHSVGQEIAIATAALGPNKPVWRVRTLNTGEPCEDENDRLLYINTRAMLYYRMLLWARSGGEFMDSPGLKDELLSIKFKRTGSGRIQIMDKVSMKKLGHRSPNKADALSQTFLSLDEIVISDYQKEKQERAKLTSVDLHDPV
jgi:hypothetical protein